MYKVEDIGRVLYAWNEFLHNRGSLSTLALYMKIDSQVLIKHFHQIELANSDGFLYDGLNPDYVQAALMFYIFTTLHSLSQKKPVSAL